MDTVFIKLVALSISGSLFALAVVLLRLIFHKAPKWVFCLLWGVVALRLVLPFSIESGLSLIPEHVSDDQIASQMEQSYVGDVTYIQEGNEDYQAALDAGRRPIQSGDTHYVVTQKDSLEEPETFKTAVLPVLSHIWALGVAVMLGYTLISYVALRSKIATATLLYSNIKQSECVDSPFVLGLLRPVIYLPYGLADCDRENVIAHEAAHIQRKDHWWKPMGFLILSVYWFNPVMWLAYILLCRDIEGACDEKVIKKLDMDGIRAYSTALLNCSVHRRSIAACPLAFGEVGVKERIKRVMHYKKPAFWIILLALLASVVAAVLLLTTPPEEVQQQNEPTEPTQMTVPVTDAEIILSLVDEIVYNPAMAASSNPYDYINAAFDKYAKILRYEDTAKECLLTALEKSPDNGLREYIMAACCAKLTDFGQSKQQTPWGSGKEWLSLYQEHLALLNEPVGREEDTIGSMMAVGNLLGIDNAWMRIVAVEDHPYRPGVHRYSYRFQYYDEKGQEWYLVEIHSCMDYRLGDFDSDGVVELFYYTDTQEYPYYICDRDGENLVEQGYSIVPDEVLDYQMLLDAEGYYLYEERWAWFLKDPETYVREVAKRPEDQMYTICPRGIIPAYTDGEVIDGAISKLHALLDGTPSDYEKKIIYKLLNEIQLSYLPELAPESDFNYGRLLEQWCATIDFSTEYYNCLQQIGDVFDADPIAFLRGVAAVDPSTLSKDIGQVVSALVQTNYLYNKDAFHTIVNRLNANVGNDAEKALADMFQSKLDGQSEPAIYTEKLLGGESTDLWRGFFYDPAKTLNVLGNSKEEQLKHLGQKLWESERWARKLLDKGYAAVEHLLLEKPEGTRKDVAYQFLLALEWEGEYSQTYIPGYPFDYNRLFEKLTYADGALATMCYSQMYNVFEADPEGFMTALSQGDWDQENIAMHFAYQYQNDGEYAAKLNQLLEMDAIAECVQVFISKLNNG